MSTEKTEYEKMVSSELHIPASSPEILKDFTDCRLKVKRYNDANYEDFEYRNKLLDEIFPLHKKNFTIEPPIYVEYGIRSEIGENVSIGCCGVIMDNCKIIIGDRTKIGPRVALCAVSHPLDYKIRAEGYEFATTVTIGKDCFIGGSVGFTPNVTVGDRVVIGAGSLVCKDIPSDCLAVGNPCKVIKKLNSEKEREEAIKEHANI